MPGSLTGVSGAKVVKLWVVKDRKGSQALEERKAPMPDRCISVDASPFSAQTLAESPFLKRARSFRVSYVSPTATLWPPGSCEQESSPHRPLPGNP